MPQKVAATAAGATSPLIESSSQSATGSLQQIEQILADSGGGGTASADAAAMPAGAEAVAAQAASAEDSVGRTCTDCAVRRAIFAVQGVPLFCYDCVRQRLLGCALLETQLDTRQVGGTAYPVHCLHLRPHLAYPAHCLHLRRHLLKHERFIL